MSERPDVPAAYDAIAEDFFASRTSVLREKMYLELALAGVSPGGKVLDFGCGTGRPIAEHLIERGFAVTGVDGSAGMLAIARQTIPSARLFRAKLEEFELDETFEAAVVWDSLFHVDREWHARIYEKLARWIVPGGGLLLSSGGDGDPGFTDRLHGKTVFYSSWTPERVVQLLEAAGFEVERCELDQPEGRGHLAVVARRSNRGIG